MRSFVDFQIFRPGEYFPTSGERARERFLARVHADVVDEFVLGLKRLALPRAVLPVADVVALLGPADVLHGDVRDHLVHGAERPVAGLFGSVHLILVDPFAGQLLLDRLPHVPEEGPRTVVRGDIHAHVHVDGVVVVVELSPVRVRPGTHHRPVRVWSAENVPAQAEVHLTVHNVSTGWSVADPLLVKSWEQQMSGVIGDPGRPVEAPRRRCKDPMLRARRRGLSDAPVPEQKVSSGVERSPAVRAHLPAVRVSQGGCVSTRLRSERRRLAGGDVVRHGADFESGGVRGLGEGIQSQTRVSVPDVVMPRRPEPPHS